MLTAAEASATAEFAAAWEREQGYKPAPFQKAIALQRMRRGVAETFAAALRQEIPDSVLA